MRQLERSHAHLDVYIYIILSYKPELLKKFPYGNRNRTFESLGKLLLSFASSAFLLLLESGLLGFWDPNPHPSVDSHNLSVGQGPHLVTSCSEDCRYMFPCILIEHDCYLWAY